MYAGRPSTPERLRAGAITAVVAGAIGWALIAGLAMGRGVPVGEALTTFEVAPPPEPPARVVPKRTRSHRPEGRAAPAGLRARATEVVAPVPLVPIVTPPPIVAAPVAGTGAAATQGAAARPGPGPGAGGIGDGRGSGGDGDGDGGEGYETKPRWLRGGLRYRDGGDQFGDAVIGRAVSLRCTLEVTGRVTGCVAARGSGLPGLDALIARLSEERYRYTPWLDEDGRPVRSTILIDHSWGEE
ncbi:energy transducer TonB [Sphingomonas rubra]|uniref:Protein TonB n=1 Tax=Sphingomonas rubra TaxID=634430 RepID=A0A1I5TJ99_9SPHN|nr:energy transducer TonB [Sphingomonas rubra]SFP82951.1 protein TonB [Sphingomonas rubra]